MKLWKFFNNGSLHPASLPALVISRLRWYYKKHIFNVSQESPQIAKIFLKISIYFNFCRFGVSCMQDFLVPLLLSWPFMLINKKLKLIKGMSHIRCHLSPLTSHLSPSIPKIFPRLFIHFFPKLGWEYYCFTLIHNPKISEQGTLLV